MNDLASRSVRLALVLDIALVIVFAVLGRASHAEALSPGGLLTTAVPFLLGLTVGWAVVVLVRTWALGWRAGVILVVASVTVGMAVRHLTGHGVSIAFVSVATSFLTLFLVGWRVVWGLVARRRDAA